MDTDDCLRAQLERVARHLGARRTADEIGVSRESLLGVIADMPVRPGTLALIRERQHVLEELDKRAGRESAP
jgi:hypothetical protein